MKRLTTVALIVWGRVGDDSPPSKPRLCLDARFLNLWTTDVPFSLDRLAGVPLYVYQGSCDVMTNLATIMFSYHHLLRLMLASGGMDSGLFVLHYLLDGKFSHIYTMPSAW